MNWKAISIIGAGTSLFCYGYWKLVRKTEHRILVTVNGVLLSIYLIPVMYYCYHIIDADASEKKWELLSQLGRLYLDLWSRY